MNVSECDSCRARGQLTGGTYPPLGWVSLSALVPRDDDRPRVMAMVYGPGSPVTWETVGQFCSWKCAAEYCAVRALIAEEAPETT